MQPPQSKKTEHLRSAGVLLVQAALGLCYMAGLTLIVAGVFLTSRPLLLWGAIGAAAAPALDAAISLAGLPLRFPGTPPEGRGPWPYLWAAVAVAWVCAAGGFGYYVFQFSSSLAEHGLDRLDAAALPVAVAMAAYFGTSALLYYHARLTARVEMAVTSWLGNQ